MNNQRILIITCNLPPLVGGMERLNWHMVDKLSQYADVKVISPSGSAKVKPNNVEKTSQQLSHKAIQLLNQSSKDN